MSPIARRLWRSLFGLALASTAARAQVAELDKVEPHVVGYDTYCGRAVALWGDRVLIGCTGDNSGAVKSGAVVVAERQPSGEWLAVAKLEAGDPEVEWAEFGSAVALEGERALIGAWGLWSMYKGRAYVFERQPDGGWLQTAKLLGSTDLTVPGDNFGVSAALSGERALVGADLKQSVHVFERQAGTWTKVAELEAPDRQAGDHFAYSLSLEGDRALVGSYRDDDQGVDSGSAYVFERQPGGTWTFAAKLRASDGASGNMFGNAVSLSGERALVGAFAAAPTSQGAAYVFERQPGGAWIEVAKLAAGDGDAWDRFGSSVALVGDRAAVGANNNETSAPYTGSAYLFERVASGAWVQVANFQAADASTTDSAGDSVALFGDRVAVGAGQVDSAGVPNAGAAYVFDWLPLSSAVTQVSLSSGGQQPLSIDAGHLHAGELRLLLGSATGPSPGLPLGGGLVLPLVSDPYLLYTLSAPGQPPLAGSLGVFGAWGSGTASFHLPAGSDPSLAGLTAWHAFVVLSTTTAAPTFASNAFPVYLAP